MSCLIRQGKAVFGALKEEWTPEFFQELAEIPPDINCDYLLVAVTDDRMNLYGGSSAANHTRLVGHLSNISGNKPVENVQYFHQLCREAGAIPFQIAIADTKGQPKGIKEFLESCLMHMMGLFETCSDTTSSRWHNQWTFTNANIPSTMGLPAGAQGGNRTLPLYHPIDRKEYQFHEVVTWTCLYDGCGEQFHTMHGITTGACFRCPHPGCGRFFSHAWPLVAHAPSHLTDRPYVCDYECRISTYKRENSLQRQVQVQRQRVSSQNAKDEFKMWPRALR